MPTGRPAVRLGMFTALPSPHKELAEPRSCCPPCPRVPALVCNLHLSLSCCSLLKLAAQLALCNTKEGRDFRDLWVIFFLSPTQSAFGYGPGGLRTVSRSWLTTVFQKGKGLREEEMTDNCLIFTMIFPDVVCVTVWGSQGPAPYYSPGKDTRNHHSIPSVWVICLW